MFKKGVAILLTAIMLFSLCACGGGEQTALEQAQAAINDGRYEDAYLILYDIEERSEEEQELFDKFAFVPLEYTRADDDGITETRKYEYNEHGLLLSISGNGLTASYTYDKNGKLLTASEGDTKTTYVYNEKGDPLSCVIVTNGSATTTNYTYNESGHTETTNFTGDHKQVITYDKNNNLLSDRTYVGGVIVEETIQTFDKNGNRLTHSKSNSSSGLWQKDNYYYNEKNQLIKSEFQTESWKNTTTYTYHENGQIATNTTTFDGGGKDIAIYDENGLLISYETIGSNGYWQKSTYTYNEAGKKLTHHTSVSTGSDHLTTYTYDENGHLLSEITKIDGTINDKHTYTYDKYGNMSYEAHIGYTGLETKNYCECTYAEDGKLLEVKLSPADITYTYTYTDDTVTFDGFTRHIEPVTLVFDKFGNILSLTSFWIDPDEGIVFDYKNDISFELKYYPNGVPEEVKNLYIDLDESPTNNYRPPLTLYAISMLRGKPAASSGSQSPVIESEWASE